jgi:hypothetical protein
MVVLFLFGNVVVSLLTIASLSQAISYASKPARPVQWLGGKALSVPTTLDLIEHENGMGTTSFAAIY